MIIFSTLLVSMFITIALIPILRVYAPKLNCVDVPSERKVHRVPIPRVGGLAIAAGFFLPILFWTIEDRVAGAILSGGAIIVLFGYIDDVRELGYRAKFSAQLAAAWIVVFGGGLKMRYFGDLLPEGYLLFDGLAIPLTLVVIVGVTNAVNLCDGLDGLAGGIMLFCYICIAFLAYRCEYQAITIMAVATGGAIFGFLKFNTHPATVFLGDAGSQLIGFLAITMALSLSQGATPISPLFPLLLFGLPVLDTLSVMFERLQQGRSLFKADKNHMHHKLLRLGLYHSEAVFIVYLLQAGLVSVAFILRFQSDWLLLFTYLGFSVGIVLFFTIAKHKYWRLARPSAFDRIVKSRLKRLIKDRRMVIRVSQCALENGFLLACIMTGMMPRSIPDFLVNILILFFSLLMLCIWIRPQWIAIMLRGFVYFLFPMIIYYGEILPNVWISESVKLFYHLYLGILVLFTITTLKTTDRKKGFKATPLDFILLFIAVILPNLPDDAIRNFNVNFLATKIIIFFFVFEVLMGEMRRNHKRLGSVFAAVFAGILLKTIIF